MVKQADRVKLHAIEDWDKTRLQIRLMCGYPVKDAIIQIEKWLMERYPERDAPEWLERDLKRLHRMKIIDEKEYVFVRCSSSSGYYERKRGEKTNENKLEGANAE